MATHAAHHPHHASSAVFPGGAAAPKTRRAWNAAGAAVAEGFRWAWYPLWLLGAVGLTCGVMELVARGAPQVTFGGR